MIASTSDKAAANQRLIKMHGNFYKAVNLFAPERDVFFFSDAPHLIKTVRNNLASSGWGRRTRHLWVRSLKYFDYNPEELKICCMFLEQEDLSLSLSALLEQRFRTSLDACEGRLS